MTPIAPAPLATNDTNWPSYVPPFALRSVPADHVPFANDAPNASGTPLARSSSGPVPVGSLSVHEGEPPPLLLPLPPLLPPDPPPEPLPAPPPLPPLPLGLDAPPPAPPPEPLLALGEPLPPVLALQPAASSDPQT